MRKYRAPQCDFGLLSWDYFLTHYERDLLTLGLDELVRKNPDKTFDELKTEVAQMSDQDLFKGIALPK